MHPAAELFAAITLAAILAAAGLALLCRLLPGSFLAAGTNERSNHAKPARQIGGLAVVPAGLVAAHAFGGPVATLTMAAIALLWLSGLADDWKPHGARFRLAIQFLAAGLALAATGVPSFLGFLPDALGFGLSACFLVWTINMVNFMDGLDLITVSGAGIPLAFLGFCLALAESGLAPLAGAMAGGLAGFALFNRPPASVFLGDNGSLPLGLTAGLAILALADQVGPLAALAPMAYYFWDSGLTLLRRLINGENILTAHSSHAYQRAFRAGSPAGRVAVIVSAGSLVCGACTLLAMHASPIALQMAAGLAGLFAGFLVYRRLGVSAG